MRAKISAKGRYVFHLILGVTLQSHGVAVPLRDMTQRQKASDKYLEQIVTQLPRTGLACSVQGARGGYFLAHKPEKCTVGEILWVLGGSLAPVSYANQNNTCRCNRADRCTTAEVWRDIQITVSSVVSRLILIDLMCRHHEKYPGYSVQNNPK